MISVRSHQFSAKSIDINLADSVGNLYSWCWAPSSNCIQKCDFYTNTSILAKVSHKVEHTAPSSTFSLHTHCITILLNWATSCRLSYDRFTCYIFPCTQLHNPAHSTPFDVIAVFKKCPLTQCFLSNGQNELLNQKWLWNVYCLETTNKPWKWVKIYEMHVNWRDILLTCWCVSFQLNLLWHNEVL